MISLTMAILSHIFIFIAYFLKQDFQILALVSGTLVYGFLLIQNPNQRLRTYSWLGLLALHCLYFFALPQLDFSALKNNIFFSYNIFSVALDNKLFLAKPVQNQLFQESWNSNWQASTNYLSYLLATLPRHYNSYLHQLLQLKILGLWSIWGVIIASAFYDGKLSPSKLFFLCSHPLLLTALVQNGDTEISTIVLLIAFHYSSRLRMTKTSFVTTFLLIAINPLFIALFFSDSFDFTKATRRNHVWTFILGIFSILMSLRFQLVLDSLSSYKVFLLARPNLFHPEIPLVTLALILIAKKIISRKQGISFRFGSGYWLVFLCFLHFLEFSLSPQANPLVWTFPLLLSLLVFLENIKSSAWSLINGRWWQYLEIFLVAGSVAGLWLFRELPNLTTAISFLIILTIILKTLFHIHHEVKIRSIS